MSFHTKPLFFAILLALSSTAAAEVNRHERALVANHAKSLVSAHPRAIKAAQGDEFVVRNVIVDADGTEHVRFLRTYSGLPVIGGDFVLHSRGGEIKGTSGTLTSESRPALIATVDINDAIVTAGAAFGSHFTGHPEATQVVYARGAKPVLAYSVRFQGVKGDKTPTDMHVIVDANSGEVLEKWDSIYSASAAGTARTLYSGDVTLTTNSIPGGFELLDPSRGGGYTINGGNGRTSGKIYTDADNVWGNGGLSDVATAAVDAQYGVAMTWDYYADMHGRNGIADDGVAAYNRVHYGRKYVNAFWSDACFCMTYGDGDGVNYGPLSSLDIAGHEMTHGVTSRTADLIYAGESGGLNEATSDIFGTMVEFYANNDNDPGDYLVGEKILLNEPAGDVALRYMYNPFKDNRSPNCYVSTLGNLDVHFSSGVANRFFYLLAEGSAAKSFNGIDHTAPTCNGGSVTGIGRDKAGEIWYRALTVYMTTSTNYAAARVATLDAATDLFGADSAEVASVAAAWSAVNVN